MGRYKIVSGIPGLEFRQTGSTFYLRITFNARERNQEGAQWVTIRKITTESGDEFPRKKTRGEEEVKIGRVKRTIEIIDAPLHEHLILAFTLGGVSPYTLFRHTRQPDNSILDEQIYPWSSKEEPSGSPEAPGLWS